MSLCNELLRTVSAGEGDANVCLGGGVFKVSGVVAFSKVGVVALGGGVLRSGASGASGALGRTLFKVAGALALCNCGAAAGLALGGGGAAAAAAALFGTGLLASVALLDASACGGIAFGGGAGFAFPPAGGTGQLFGTTTGGGDTCTGVAFALVDGDEDSATCAPTFRLAAVAFALARMACTKSMLGVGAGAGGAFTALGGMRNPARITADKHEKLGNTWNDNI